MLKSDRFGMETVGGVDIFLLFLLLVKIRPFRYGNARSRKMGLRTITKLKSDRFGMETYRGFFKQNAKR